MPPFRLEEGLGHWAARLSWAARGALERRLKSLGIKPPQMAALLAVDGGAGRASEVAKVMGVDAGAITRLMDQLCEEGLVSRCELKGDRRSRRIELTEKAKKALPKLRKAASDMEATLTLGLGREEKAQLIGLLKKLTEKADAS